MSGNSRVNLSSNALPAFPFLFLVLARFVAVCLPCIMIIPERCLVWSDLDVGGKDVGLLMSIGNTVANLPGVVVPVAGAWFRQRYGSFAPLFGAVAALHLLSAAAFRLTVKDKAV